MTRQKLYDQIYQDFQKRTQQSKTELNSGDCEFEMSDQQEFLKQLFVNFSPTHHSLELSHTGFEILKTMYQTWHVPLSTNSPVEIRCGRVKLALHRHLAVPYHINSQGFWTFGSQVALELEMAERDIVLWAKMFG